MAMSVKYKLTVTYAAGHDQEHRDLSKEQADMGTGAFLSDLLNLEGRGITKLVVETQEPRGEHVDSLGVK